MRATPLPRAVALGWGAAAAAALGLLPLLGPVLARLPACPLRAGAGVPCPACGSGRALLALAGGEPWAALAANPLAVLFGTGFVLAGLAAAAAELAGRPLVEPRALPLWLRAAFAAALAGNWLYLLGAGR